MRDIWLVIAAFNEEKSISQVIDSLKYHGECRTDSFYVSNLSNGVHYLAVLAKNEEGYSLSNCINVTIHLIKDFSYIFARGRSFMYKVNKYEESVINLNKIPVKDCIQRRLLNEEKRHDKHRYTENQRKRRHFIRSEVSEKSLYPCIL